MSRSTSRVRALGAAALALAVVLGAAACSSDDTSGSSSDRPKVTFSDPPPGSTDLGLCTAYPLPQIKELIGGDENFKRLAPEAIGAEGADVTGEACRWERAEPNGDSLTLSIEARDFGADTATLASQFQDLQEGTIAARPVTGIGDGAFSSVSDETSLLQVRTGQYLLTLASRSNGELKPVPLDALQLLAASGVEQLS